MGVVGPRPENGSSGHGRLTDNAKTPGGSYPPPTPTVVFLYRGVSKITTFRNFTSRELVFSVSKISLYSNGALRMGLAPMRRVSCIEIIFN